MSRGDAGALEGRRAIVTGAAGTIGAAVARRLCESGARVCLLDVVAPLQLAAELDPRRDGRAMALSLDVRDAGTIRSRFSEAVEVFGGLDLLVTVAGVVSFGSFESISEAEWDRVQAINPKGVFLCDQAALAPMKAGGYGRIVNIGSILAKNGGNARPWLDASEQNRSGNAAYGAAKAGVHALTSYLAREVARCNITVNAVAPGPIASPMTTDLPEALRQQIPVGQLGTADEVAEAVAFLCGPHSAFITGEVLDVNGGHWTD